MDFYQIIQTILQIIIHYKWTILFYTAIILTIFINRKRFDIEMGFVALLRTKIGLGLMDSISSRFNKTVRFLGYMGIYIGYFGLIIFLYLLIKLLIQTITVPGTVGASPVLPGVPIAGTGITIPLIAGWIALFVIVVVHEFSHGVVARAHGIKIKSSGIAFFGPLLAAFVEPDDKQLEKVPPKVSKSVFAAGPFSNIILTAVVVALLLFVLNPVYMNISQTTGIRINTIPDLPATQTGIPDSSVITQIDGTSITNYTQLVNTLGATHPGEHINITTLKHGTYTVTATNHPENDSKGYIGITATELYVTPKAPGKVNAFLFAAYAWILELLQWIAFLSINIGLINLFPIFITDGAKILGVDLTKIIKNSKRAEKVWTIINKVGVALLLALIILPIIF